MRFPYYQLGPTDFAPIIPLKILGKGGWLALEAYIDSGASFSIFNIDRAEILGIAFNLLGRQSFFNKFKICFNDRDRFVDITKL